VGLVTLPAQEGGSGGGGGNFFGGGGGGAAPLDLSGGSVTVDAAGNIVPAAAAAGGGAAGAAPLSFLDKLKDPATISTLAGLGLPFLTGKNVGKVGPSIFGNSPLAQDLENFLSEQLNTPVTEGSQFQSLSTALQEQLAGLAKTQKQTAGEAAQTGGYADSGALLGQFGDIDRAQLEAFSSGLREIIQYLESKRTEDILPFLSAQAEEQLGKEAISAEAGSSRRLQNLSFISDIFGRGGPFSEGSPFEGIFR